MEGREKVRVTDRGTLSSNVVMESWVGPREQPAGYSDWQVQSGQGLCIYPNIDGATSYAIMEVDGQVQGENVLAGTSGWMDNFIIDSIHSTCITIVHIHQHIKNRPRHCTASP